MDGFITTKRPVNGLVDSTGASIPDNTVFQMQALPKRGVLRIRVVEGRDPTNTNMLLKLGLRLESASGASPTPDVILVAQLDNPSGPAIAAFFAHVAYVTGLLSSDTDEELEFKSVFP